MDKKHAVKLFLQTFFGNAEDRRFDFIEQISRFQKLGKKQLLFSEDEAGSEFYFLASGKIKLFRSTSDGKEAIIRFITPGEYFAEILLQLKSRYPVSSVAIEPSEVLAIDANKILKHIEQNPDVAMYFIAALSQRIKYLLGMIEQLTLADIRQRFINYLLMLRDKSNTDRVELPAAKGEIALLLGTTAETFSRLLKKLAGEGYIRVEGRTIILLKDRDQLTDS
ncbi:MAG: Crp/Fnr family transcriptional regulator [Desulfobacteraceae bacterium 4572_35.1]|nr:MAG: Crp/Fnr family transcriptional regulator [Desulfobacteraceae bacterium 4572_35.1]